MTNANFLSIAEQNNLKESYKAGLADIWNADMVKFCLNDVDIYVPICGGKHIIGISKETIKKDFYFGYSSCGQGPDWDTCMNDVDNARKDIVNQFIYENTAIIDDNIKTIKDIIESGNDVVDSLKCPYTAYCTTQYYGESSDNVVSSLQIVHYSREQLADSGATKMTIEDLKTYLAALEEHKARILKKLNTYIKKYGTSKLRIHTYWIDE